MPSPVAELDDEFRQSHSVASSAAGTPDSLTDVLLYLRGNTT